MLLDHKFFFKDIIFKNFKMVFIKFESFTGFPLRRNAVHQNLNYRYSLKEY
jgi:hypothetical protein